MRKFTLLIASLFLTIGVMAQTPVLELTSEKIGTSYPVVLSDEDAQKIFALGDVTIEIDVTLPSSLSGRKALVVACDPTADALTSSATGVKTNSPYYGFGINGSDAGYFASSKVGDRFTAGANTNTLVGGGRCTLSYVIDNTNKVITVIANGVVMYSCVYPVLEYEMPNFVNISSRLSSAKIYIGAGMTSSGSIDVFNGTVHSVRFYSGCYANTYFRFKATDTNTTTEVRYLVAGENNITTSTTGTGTESIFYYCNNTLLSYSEGKHITYGNHTALGTNPSMAIIHSSDAKSPYKIYVAGKYIESNSSQANGIGFYTRSFNSNLPSTSGSNFTIETVASLPVTITDAQYATFFAPVEVTVPEGVEAYYVTADGVNSTYITLTKIENGVVPANTGVILYAEAAGAYDLNITTTGAAAIEDNLLRGTAAATYVTDDAYVLAKDGNNEAYLGKATKNQSNSTAFLNNSHKAYLVLPATASEVASYSFRFGEGTTGISEVKGENGNVKSIFDLTGRRIENITAPGIYVVNGKKVLVK